MRQAERVRYREQTDAEKEREESRKLETVMSSVTMLSSLLGFLYQGMCVLLPCLLLCKWWVYAGATW